jgi:hypothetical protein
MDDLRALDTHVRRRDPHLLVVGSLQDILARSRKRARKPAKRARPSPSR